MKKLILTVGLLLASLSGAAAQNTTCSNRPIGDSSNACANTRFVAVAAAAASVNTYTPEQYYLTADGTNWGLAIERAMAALAALPTGGTLKLGCGTTYTISTAVPATNAIVLPRSNVNIVGCGPSSIIKVADGVNTSSASFINGIYAQGTVNNAYHANFTVDMNGANNSCTGTCYHSNAAYGMYTGSGVWAENINFLNNPGSNDTVIGTNASPPTVSDFHMRGIRHYNFGDRVNAASTDFSADFIIASNYTVSDVTYGNGPTVNGAAWEWHGVNGTITSLVVDNVFNCGIIANLVASPLTQNINVTNVECNKVTTGPQLYSFAAASLQNITLAGITINFITGVSRTGLDACSNMSATSTNNYGLSIKGVIINSDVTTNLSNETPGVSACYWTSQSIEGVQGTNIQGPGILIDNVITNASISLSNSHFTNVGRTATAANQVGARFINTSGNTAANITISNFTTTGTVVYNISGNVAATQASIDNLSLASGASTGQWNVPAAWSAGLWPQAQINFRGTGGTGQFVKQASLAGALTVAAPIVSELGGLGTGVATALGTNLNVAGGVAPITSPSFGGTPATPTAAVDTNTTQIASTAYVIGQAAAATPLASTTAGAVGTSTRYARADHIHPAASAYSQLTFSTGNLNAILQATTWFFTTAENVGTENVVAIPMSNTGTIDKMYCSSNAAPGGAAQTFIMTMRKNAADQAVTCTMTTGGASTCNDTTHSFTVVPGDLIAVKLVTSATSGTAAGMNCGLRFAIASP